MNNLIEWRPVLGFEDYLVSNTGLIKSLPIKFYWRGVYKVKKEKILKPSLNKRGKGYYQINLIKDKKIYCKFIHQIVAETFIGKVDGLVIDHIDGNSLNNSIENLQYVSHHENIRRYYKNNINKKSKYLNVSFDKKYKKWHAYFQYLGKKRKFLGYHNCETKAYFAVLNYINCNDLFNKLNISKL